MSLDSWARDAKKINSRYAADIDRVDKLLLGYRDNVEEHFDNGMGLLLVGPPGRGKTHAACALLNDIAEETPHSIRYIGLTSFVRLTQLTFSLEAAWRSTSSSDAYDEWYSTMRVLKKMRNDIDFLVIDDVGKEYRGSNTGFAEGEFEYTLRHRYDLGLPTIMTSNVPVNQWGEQYGAAMESFLKEAVFTVPMDDVPDLRA